MRTIIIKPSKELEIAAKNAVDKFNGICNASLKVEFEKNMNAAANLIEGGAVDILFLPTELEMPEINTSFAIYKKARKKPFIICCADVFEKLKLHIPKSEMLRVQKDFDEQFVFNCIRSLLTPQNQKLDIRYIKSIITSVISVVRENTEVNLTPGKIFEQKAQEKPEQVTGVLAFYGDGFLGSLTLSIELKLLKHFAIKMLYCEESDLTIDLMTDVFNEICNQILGVIRTELGEFGYRLVTSLQSVTVNEGSFLHGSSSNGQYYSVPFIADQDLGKFDIVLCYNTYRMPLKDLITLEDNTVNQKESVLDIRLVETAVESTKNIITSNIGIEAQDARVSQHQGEVYNADSLHIFHVGGFEGSATISLVIPKITSGLFFNKMMGMGLEDLEDEGINDLFGEMINQIGGEFVKTAKTCGYSFQRIFHGTYSSQSEFNFLLKNPGLYTQMEIVVDGFPLILIFGMNSQHAKSFYNVWHYYQGQKNFKEKFELKLPESLDDASQPEEKATEEVDDGAGLFFEEDAKVDEPKVSEEQPVTQQASQPVDDTSNDENEEEDEFFVTGVISD